MKANYFVAALAILALAACAKKNDAASGPPAPPSSLKQSVAELTVGEPGSPAANTIELAQDANPGAIVSFNWKAARDGRIQFNPSSAMGINCNISEVKATFTLNGGVYADADVQMPKEIEVRGGTDYSLKFQLAANSCLSYMVQFTAAWLAADVKPRPQPTPQPSPTPAPVRPKPQPEAGFLGEEELTSRGGNIFVTQPKEDTVYRDYYFEVTRRRSIYKSAGAGASSCPGEISAKLELLEISLTGEITKRTQLGGSGAMPEVVPGVYYRLRWSVSPVKACRSVSEGFNVGWL